MPKTSAIGRKYILRQVLLRAAAPHLPGTAAGLNGVQSNTDRFCSVQLNSTYLTQQQAFIDNALSTSPATFNLVIVSPASQSVPCLTLLNRLENLELVCEKTENTGAAALRCVAPVACSVHGTF